MNRLFFGILILFFAFLSLHASAATFGTYKTETEYGLIDGFKWNIFGRKKGDPWVELKSETKEEQIRLEREKNRPKEVQDDVQLYRFMLEDTVAF